MTFNAIEDKVIVKIAKVEETTDSGLFIPDSIANIPDQGTVVAVGPGRYTSTGAFMASTVSVGDRVVFSARHAQRIELDGEEYLIFLNEHILATITD